MRTTLILGLVFLGLAGLAGYLIYSARPEVIPPPIVVEEEVEVPALLSYSSSTLAFRYPDTYLLEERDLGNAERRHYSITLAQKAALPAPIGGEGPPTITIDLYQNDLDSLSTDTWIRASNDSHFKLSRNGLIASTAIAGNPARSYGWDGLYSGRTIAIARPDYIYAFSVTSLTPEDAILDDFRSLLQTVLFR